MQLPDRCVYLLTLRWKGTNLCWIHGRRERSDTHRSSMPWSDGGRSGRSWVALTRVMNPTQRCSANSQREQLVLLSHTGGCICCGRRRAMAAPSAFILLLPDGPPLTWYFREAAEVQRNYGGRSGASAAALSPLIVLPRCSEPEGSTAQPLVNFVLANLALSQLFAPAYPAVVASPHHAEHSTRAALAELVAAYCVPPAPAVAGAAAEAPAAAAAHVVLVVPPAVRKEWVREGPALAMLGRTEVPGLGGRVVSSVATLVAIRDGVGGEALGWDALTSLPSALSASLPSASAPSLAAATAAAQLAAAPSHVRIAAARYGLWRSGRTPTFGWGPATECLPPLAWEVAAGGSGTPPPPSTAAAPASPTPRHVAVLGGSFSPITDAHLGVAGDVLRSLARDRSDGGGGGGIEVAGGTAVDEVWVVPCGARPDKPSLSVSPAHRYIMTALGVEDAFADEPRVKAVPLELWEPTAVPSYTLLGRLAAAYPTTSFSLVIGADLVPTLSTWRHAANLLAERQFIVVPRLGYVALPSRVISDGVEPPRPLHALYLLPSLPCGGGGSMSSDGGDAGGSCASALSSTMLRERIAAHPRSRRRPSVVIASRLATADVTLLAPPTATARLAAVECLTPLPVIHYIVAQDLYLRE